MSKKTTEETTQQPTHVTDLLVNGTTTLTAKVREDFDAMLKEIPAEVKYSVGAVGFNNDSGVFTLRVDILKD